jgi:hypothetical protein
LRNHDRRRASEAAKASTVGERVGRHGGAVGAGADTGVALLARPNAARALDERQSAAETEADAFALRALMHARARESGTPSQPSSPSALLLL